ncbi:MAG: S9 family peptidase [Myxococcales bacterium]|nr:S9 family peptidase [Myxococcales bacterium]
MIGPRWLTLAASLLASSLAACGAGSPSTPDDGARAPADAKTPAPRPGPDAAEPTPPLTATAEATPPAALEHDPLPRPPEGPHPFGVRDLIALDRLSDHAVSPDGKTVALVRRTLDHATGKGHTDLWTVPVTGGPPSQLTDDDAADASPRWSPDGASLYFLSSRGGTTQVWRMPAGGGAATAITDLPLPVETFAVSPAGDRIALTTWVFVDCEDLACTKRRLDERARDPSSGRTYDQLMVRHWDHYRDGRRSHLLTLALAGGDPIDLTAGQDADVPSQPFGGAEDYTFSPDGKTVVYTARDVGRQEAWSTDFDLYAIAADGSGERRELTGDNPAWDASPVFSPDGTTLAWTAMATPGYESDRFAIKVRAWPDGETRTVADGWDRSARSLGFEPGGESLLVTAQHVGQVALFRVGLADGAVTELASDGTISGPAVAGERIVFARHDLRRPADLWSMPRAGGEATPITALNAEHLARVQLGQPEQFEFSGWNGETVHGYVVEPADFAEGERYPVAFLIHGGPQGSFGNMFHYRWNAQTYAGAGQAVVMIDFHGSTGYGQAFTDSIQGDWGGKPLVDLQRGLAAAIERYPWLDGDRVCALGASYGGYMINWIAGNWPDRFRCLVDHDGIFDNRMGYYATEELWFPEREHGAPYYEDPAAYERHNPAHHVLRWQTPMLVIHGSLDYRLPETQGLATFTALQRRGIESRYVVFPDENHWVLSAANSLRWHHEVETWLSRWLAAEGP